MEYKSLPNQLTKGHNGANIDLEDLISLTSMLSEMNKISFCQCY